MIHKISYVWKINYVLRRIFVYIMKFIFMYRDELGHESRAYGSEFLEKIHEFPNYDSDDEAMTEAFYVWKNMTEDKGNKEWRNIFGSESTVFLEREHSDMSMSDWHKLGYGDY